MAFRRQPPINRLPPELLGSIFSESVPDAPPVSPTSPPLLLTTVCRKWRDVALTTPEVWSRIDISFHVDGNSYNEEALAWKGEAMIAWMKRAGKRMSVTLALRNSNLAAINRQSLRHLFKDILSPTFDTLFSKRFTRKWANVVLNDIHQPYRSLLLSIDSRDLPRLKSFRCNWRWDYDMCDWSTFPEMEVKIGNSPFISSPNITAIHIFYFDNCRIKDLSLSNWSTLTELHLNTGGRLGRGRRITPWALFEVVDLCKSTLTSLSVGQLAWNACECEDCGVDRSPSPEFLQSSPSCSMTLPRLQHLLLQGRADLEPYLSSTSTPCLKTFNIKDCDTFDTPDSSGGTIQAFLGANPGIVSQLTAVAFAYSVVSKEGLDLVLRLLGREGLSIVDLTTYFAYDAEEFRLQDYPGSALFTRDVLQTLIPMPGEVPLFPKLEIFRCITAWDREITDRDMLDFLCGRFIAWWESQDAVNDYHSPISKLLRVYVKIFAPRTINLHEEITQELAQVDGFPLDVVEECVIDDSGSVGSLDVVIWSDVV